MPLMQAIGTIRGLWRYPIKSLRGEQVEHVELDERGVVGDRVWGLVDPEGKIASGKHTRRFRRVAGLMHHAARYDGDTAVIVLANGREIRVDDPATRDAVTTIAGEEWRLARERTVSHFDAGSVHLVTSSTLEHLARQAGKTVEPERLRPNILLQVSGLPAFGEDRWMGAELIVESARFRVTSRVERCVMANHSQTSLPYRRDVLRTIGKTNGACAGIYLDVLQAATLRAGQTVWLEPAR
jgi:uncharacterized protein YcbX